MRKPRVIYTDNSLEFGKSCEELSSPKIQYTKEVEVRVRSYKGIRCINQLKPKKWRTRRSTTRYIAWIAVHRKHTHSVRDVQTVCSQARTNVTACLSLKSRWFIIFVRLKESIFRSAMSHPCWSFPHLLTSNPQHAALPGPRDLLQDHTVHPQPHPQEPLQPLPQQLPHEPLPANAIRSENNAKESLSDPEYQRAGNLRINTPTGYEPKGCTTEEIATFPMMSLEGDVYQFSMYRENWENKIHKLQLWKRRKELDKSRYDGKNVTH